MITDKILIIDDESGIRSTLQGILEDENYIVKTTDTAEKGLNFLNSENFDLVLLDIWLPEMNGLEALENIKKLEENINVVMITGHGSVEAAVKATKLGAYDFLEKPLSLEKVVLTVKNALKQKKLEAENIQLREKMKTKYQLIGKSASIDKLKEKIKTAAPSNGSILLFGENGTGKELIARLIHKQSPRKNKSFIHLNCAAIPDNLMEKELFGYVKGSPSDRKKDKKGKLLLADGGTLFLDDIGEMSIETQTKLVKIIDEQKFYPLESTEPIPINVRFIAATNKNLRGLIRQKIFREDLYFKLNVIPLVVPPLRERKEDIPVLIDYYLKYFSIETGKQKKTMSKDAVSTFINYQWPGNVSELINVIERFVIMIADNVIKTSHLYLLVEPRELQFISGVNENTSLEKARDQFEREFIHSALIKNQWDISKTASDLKINRNNLDKKIIKLGITFLG